NGAGHFLVAHAGTAEIGLFTLLLTALWAAEQAGSALSAGAKLRHSLVNGVFLSAALPVQAAISFLCLSVARWTVVHHIGLAFALPFAADGWAAYAVLFVALDLLDYGYHVVMHRVPLLWRFHLAHHTDRVVDVSTTFREHPGETAIRNLFLLGCIVVCGVPVELLVLRQMAQAAINIFAHTSLHLPPAAARVVGWVFMTPNLHHVHHHVAMPATNSNYAEMFTVWDRLFGTYMEMRRADIVYGLDTHMSDAAVARAERLAV
ncbi:MAG: sterol desaturase family protein, partial [Alphaproteobacteria bacterium]|nr:sterol desaturase family protein [Alphaproteobacteria bacterium]